MIETITLLIDNDKFLLNHLIRLASQHTNKYDLAREIKELISCPVDEDLFRITTLNQYTLNNSVEYLFRHILYSAINNITEYEWEEIAEHYLTKAREMRKHQ